MRAETMRMNVRNTMLGLSLLACAAAIASPGSAHAQSCTLIVDADTGHTRIEDGDCNTRYTPASTFKVPLALMGFDSGLLTDAHTPRWEWPPNQRAPQRDRKPVDPTIWEADSVVWYSRELTRRLGAARFGAYVHRLVYGNEDVAGDPGEDNGLTRSWISSSLKISPREQAAFIRRLLAGDLPVSAEAQQKTKDILPVFETASGWRVHGKTGSGSLPSQDKTDKGKPVGWFVGWAERDGKTIVFARQNIGTDHGRQGLAERTRMLALLETM